MLKGFSRSWLLCVQQYSFACSLFILWSIWSEQVKCKCITVSDWGLSPLGHLEQRKYFNYGNWFKGMPEIWELWSIHWCKTCRLENLFGCFDSSVIYSFIQSVWSCHKDPRGSDHRPARRLQPAWGVCVLNLWKCISAEPRIRTLEFMWGPKNGWWPETWCQLMSFIHNVIKSIWPLCTSSHEQWRINQNLLLD